MYPDPLRILCLSDGRPGHEKQTAALLHAFSERIPVADRWFRIPDGRSFVVGSRFAALFLAHSQKKRKRLLNKWGWDTEGFLPHLVMGAGSHTHGALVIAARYYDARSIVLMTPDKLVAREVDLVVAPRHDGGTEGERRILTFGPPCRIQTDQERREDRGVILIGGADPASHVWETRSVVAAVRSLCEENRTILWQVTSSPRTPDETEYALAQLAGRESNLRFIPFHATEPGWVEAAYGESSRAWVTADSMSMVYEALTAGCRVGVIPVRWKKPENKFQESLDALHAAGYIHYPGEDEDAVCSSQLDEAARCVQEVMERWWPNA